MQAGYPRPILVGGAAVEFYTGGAVVSGDFDIVTPAETHCNAPCSPRDSGRKIGRDGCFGATIIPNWRWVLKSSAASSSTAMQHVHSEIHGANASGIRASSLNGLPQPARSPLTSGKAGMKRWLLRFDRRTPRFIEPLMGWTGGDDTLAQVALTFPTREAAVAYAERQGLVYVVHGQDGADRAHCDCWGGVSDWPSPSYHGLRTTSNVAIGRIDAMTKSMALLTTAGIMAAGLVSIAAWADDIGPQLKGDEIIKALVGPKLTGASPKGQTWTAQYKPDGTAQWGDGSSGKWRLKGNQFCDQPAGGQDVCVSVFKAGDKKYQFVPNGATKGSVVTAE